MNARPVMVLALVTVAIVMSGVTRARAAAAFDSTAARARGRALAEVVRGQDAARLWESFSDTMRAAMHDSSSFRQANGIMGQAGALERVERDTVMRRGDKFLYRAEAKFSRRPVTLDLLFAFDPDGRVGGFTVRPGQRPYPSPNLTYQTQAPLHLPFYGEWTIFWGGRSVDQNQHAIARDQRFAYDIVMMRDGSTHQGEGHRNEDYWCFGQPIVAPAGARVAAAADTVGDNVPGVMNSRQALGNHVILDLGHGEYAVLAHLAHGSVRVKTGQQVTAGDTLGRCGNSGNSSEPHMHFHLQNGATPFDADGLPAAFVDYVADGKPVARGEPVKGERIHRP